MRIALSLLLYLSLNIAAGELHELVKLGNVDRVHKFLRMSFFQRVRAHFIGEDPRFDNDKVDCEDEHKRTALFYAPHVAMARLLVLDYGARTNRIDVQGQTPLFSAASKNQVDILRFFIDLGMKAHHKDHGGRTALFFAALQNAVDAVRFLLEFEGYTPFTVVQSKEIISLGNQQIIQMLHSKNLLVQQLDVKFDSIGGYASVKEQLIDYLSMIKHFEKYQKFGMKTVPHTILHGPPGTGKTLFAVALAAECDIPFVLISGSELRGKYLGESSERVRNAFAKIKQMARENGTPGILIIDEFDSIGKSRESYSGNLSSEESATVNQLLTELDGGNNKGSTQDLAGMVFVIAITNHLKSIDPALLRSGRLSRHIFVGLPDQAERKLILETYKTRYPFSSDIDFDLIAAKTFGCSGADLAQLLEESAFIAVKNIDKNVITMDDIFVVLNKHRTSEKKIIQKPKAQTSTILKRLLARVYDVFNGDC
jgi:ATP-dependent Zn protease